MQDIIICRCEEVTLAQLKTTAKQFNCSARELKLRTRAGMGYCGGRTCRPIVDKVLIDLTKHNPENNIALKIAPPIRPVSLKQLGGGLNHE